MIHLARLLTGRERIVVFEGKYQGHLVELLAVWDEGRTVHKYLGVTDHDIARTTVLTRNDGGGTSTISASTRYLKVSSVTPFGCRAPNPQHHHTARRSR